MRLEFTGEIIEWRGPAPFLFIRTPDWVTEEIKSVSRRVTYGWGCITVTLLVGKTTVKTALFPREGAYMVPIKMAVQKAENVSLGDTVSLSLELEISAASLGVQ